MLFSKPLIECAVDCTAGKSTRLLDSGAEIRSELASKDGQRARSPGLEMTKALYTK